MATPADRKKAVDEILGAGPSKAPDSEHSALESVAQELIDAVHAKDAAGVAEALKAAYAECGSEEPSTNDED